MSGRIRIGRCVGFLACALLLGAHANAAKYNIRWVLSHDPSVAAEQSARDFAASIEKETSGDVRVEVIKSVEYNKRVSRTVSHRGLTRDLAEGKVEMAQMYTAGLALYGSKLFALGNPYLFRDYDHAESVFESPLGQEIIAALPPSSGLRALGIAYSGGYGIFATKDREVRRPKDMRGLKLQTDRFPWLPGYVKSLGVEPISAPPEAFVMLAKNGLADAVETTVARFDEYGDDRGANVIINTDHFLLTTMIIINEKFYQSLPARYQTILSRLALDTAREERVLSIKANVDGRTNLERRGVKFIDLTAEEKKLFVNTLPAIFTPWTKDLTAAIRNTATVRTAQR